jgi:hypothetical protein
MLHCLRLLLLLVLAVAVSGVQAHGPVPKPKSPLSIRIEPAVAEVTGRAVDYRVTVVSVVDADHVSIEVTLPEGSVVHSGALHWQGSLSSDDKQVLRFRATVPDRSHAPIVAVAMMGEAGQSQFSARAVYQTLPPSEFAAAAEDKPRVVMRNGRRIDEYELK